MSVNYDKVEVSNEVLLYRGDCLDVLPALYSQGLKVDMVLADPPYGTTHCRWDAVIDMPDMWACLASVTSASTPILLFGQQPFTCVLGCSNLRDLRYNWVWEKTQGTGFLNAKRMPLKCHEDILVFYRSLPKYFPVMTDGHPRKVVKADHRRKCNDGEIYHSHDKYQDYCSTQRYPRSVIRFKTDKQLSSLHPTQKPVALLEYLIHTYTEKGDTVLDFTMGSGSTGVACRNTDRRFIGIEKDADIFEVARQRIAQAA